MTGTAHLRAHAGGTVLVTGVTGHAAAVMADRLHAGGLQVRTLVRTAEQASWATQRGWEPVRGDRRVPRSLAPAADGASTPPRPDDHPPALNSGRQLARDPATLGVAPV
jgi:uncharacterized protein YbjT (DUF2867 family)